MKNNKKLKICLMTLGAYPVPATSGGAVENLTEIMAENYQKGDFDFSLDIISIYTPEAEEKSKEYDKVNFHFIQYSNFIRYTFDFVMRVIRKLTKCTIVRFDPFFSRALKIIRDKDFDVVISENAVLYVNPLKRYCRSKIVFHMHNEYFELTNIQPKKHIGKADMVVSVSDFVGNLLRESKGFDVPVYTVRNVVDTAQFAYKDFDRIKEIRNSYGFSDDDIVLIYVGRLIPEKGIGLLMDAMEKVDNAKVKLLVVGGSAFSDSQITEYVQKLYDKAEHSGGRIVFTGFVSYDKLAQYYQASDIAVFASQWIEAAGLVVLEAQSAGKPVIMSCSGGMPEYVSEQSAIIIENGDGFTDRLAESIIKLSSSPELRAAMGSAAIENVQNFSKNNYLKNLMDTVQG